MSENLGDTWVEVDRLGSHAEAQQGALVLVAVGIDCQIAPHGESFGLLVASSDAARAQSELAAYVRDNRLSSPPLPPLRPLRAGLVGALVYGCALLFVYGAASRQTFSHDWVSDGKAIAGAIVGGEWWRALSALALHADYAHLFANLVAGAFLGVVLSQVLGAGLAWLLILLAGGIGNGLNALIQPPEHAAIGASTAVFGALGLLAVLMSKYQRSLWNQGLRRWVPLAAGVMLLAFLGIEGERTDVGAHITGFFVGCLLGGILVVIGERSTAQKGIVQYAFAVAAFMLFIGPWLIALAG